MKAVFVAFFAFVKKEFLHIFRDIRTQILLFLMPIIQILLFGFALSAEVKNIELGILNLAKDSTSLKLVQGFEASEYFNLRLDFSSYEELEKMMKGKELDMALLIKENFALSAQRGEQALQLIIDGSDPNRASIIRLYAQNIIASNLSSSNFDSNTQNLLQISQTMLFNPQGESVYNFLPGILGMIMLLICAMMTSISIVREKELGSMEVLLVSPIKPALIIVAKFIPYLLISFASLLFVLAMSFFVFGLKMSGNLALMLGFCMLYILLALSIGLLVSNLANNQITAMLVCGIIFMMPTMIFSGMIFPIESMPVILQYLTHIMPAKWFILGLKKIMIEALGFEFILKEFFVLLAMLVCILALSIKSFKTRLE